MRIPLLVFNLLLAGYSAPAQGTFRNLDFGLSSVPPSTASGMTVSSASAFPFWNLYVDNNQISTVTYNDLGIGSAEIALLAANSPVGALVPGHNTAVLQAGILSLARVSAGIAQTGVIPTDARSLLFVASAPYDVGWSVTIGSQALPVVQVSPVAPNLFLYGGDISAFAGQTEELRFTALAGSGPPVNMFLGDIQFSQVAVPEPAIPALLAFGGLLLATRFLKRTR